METFVNFYVKKWNVKKTILLVGITEDSFSNNSQRFILDRVRKLNNHPFEKQKIKMQKEYYFCNSLNYYSSDNVCVLTYKTNVSTAHHEWNWIKDALFSLCDYHLLEKDYNKVINIDNDEFLVMKKGKLPADKESFHFIEHVPPLLEESFKWDNKMKWCIQGWYYRTLQQRCAAGLSHGTCKKYNFSRKNMVSLPFHHTGKTPIAENCKKFDINKLEESNVCYHMGVLDYSHYRDGKTINHDGNQMGESYEQATKTSEKNYTMYYQNPESEYVTIENDYIKKYLVCRKYENHYENDSN